jgi:large subunit ribosomal protein L18
MAKNQKRAARERRHVRVRKKVAGSAARPRLAVYRSNKFIYAQLVDDVAARTLAQASDREVSGDDKTARAKAAGELLSSRAKDAGIERVVFDRGGRLYHGRVAALADGAREGGLQI